MTAGKIPTAPGNTQPPSAAALPPLVEEHLCRFIRAQTGIAIMDHQLANLRDTVNNALNHFGHASPEAFLRVLQEQDGRLTEELEYLVGGITVGESYFFRGEEQFSFLRNDFLPSLISRKRLQGTKALRIWSAGCSGGQELYSIAILLHELLPDLSEWNVHLLGTDINAEILSSAISGKYTAWSLRATPDEVIKKNFTQSGGLYTIRPDLRRLVNFSYLNIFTDNFPSILTGTNALDLILCRNVFIYFNADAIARVMDKYTGCLVPGGIILLGPADFYNAVNPALQFHSEGMNFYYQRRADDGKSPLHAPVPPPCEPPASVDPVFPTGADEPVLPRASQKVVEEAAQGHHLQRLLEEIIQLIAADQWQAVIEAVDAATGQYGGQAALFQFKAKALANLGDLDGALAHCERSLKLNATDHHTYLIMAIILIELDSLTEAENLLRKALFLDRDLVEAHYHLGILNIRMNQKKKGIRSLRNALLLAEKQDPGNKIHNAHDMTYSRFAEILRSEIDMHEGGNPGGGSHGA